MRSFTSVLVFAVLAPAAAFVAVPVPPRAAAAAPLSRVAGATMGPAKDGPFTPAVRAARLILGDQLLLKVRGKAISYHSQYINQFCGEFGVPKKINQGLIKKAKIVGSDLGFLS